MSDLRFAVLGAGFWTRYQLAAWREVEGVRCVALCNRTRARAEALAREFEIPAVYDDPEELLRREKPAFLDVITDPSTHGRFVRLAARHRVPVICQKPMAPTLREAEEMVRVCRESDTPFFVHENFRWQAPFRDVKRALDAGAIGRPFRARLSFNSGFPVFRNQPFLKELEEFILADVGTHLLDVVRFLFGEVGSLACRIHRIHEGIRGEDVATALLHMKEGATVVVELSYASRPEKEPFPETQAVIEGAEGSLVLAPGCEIRITTATGTTVRTASPPRYPWADPAYALVHASIVPCHADLLGGLRGGHAETTGDDNLKTLRLVHAAYESARSGRTVTL